MIIVAQDGSSSFDSIQDAIDSITMLPETIYVKKGTYRERIEVRCPYLTIEGEDANETIIEYDFHARMDYTETEKRGTFRSYTMLVTGEFVTLKNLTIANTAGSGDIVGQALALYAEGANFKCENCRLLGHQDTLFTGPLPKAAAKVGGFAGPTENNPRVALKQLYKDCYIEGDVDFIFGSAIAYFDNCQIHSLNRDKEVNGYVTAASSYEEEKYGYVFNNCNFTSDCAPDTVYLGRPWREHAKVVLINCNIGDHIKPVGFMGWNTPVPAETVFYAEYNSTGAGSHKDLRGDYVKQLTDEEAEEYTLENVFK